MVATTGRRETTVFRAVCPGCRLVSGVFDTRKCSQLVYNELRVWAEKSAGKAFPHNAQGSHGTWTTHPPGNILQEIQTGRPSEGWSSCPLQNTSVLKCLSLAAEAERIHGLNTLVKTQSRKGWRWGHHVEPALLRNGMKAGCPSLSGKVIRKLSGECVLHGIWAWCIEVFLSAKGREKFKGNRSAQGWHAPNGTEPECRKIC